MHASPVIMPRAERRELLALACELDRLQLRLALRPAPSDALSIAGLPATALSKALSFTQFLPGNMGRIARAVALGSKVIRMVKPFIGTRR